MYLKEKSEENVRPGRRVKTDIQERRIRLRNQNIRIAKQWANASKDKRQGPRDIRLNEAGDQIKLEDPTEPTDIKPLIRSQQLELDPTVQPQTLAEDLCEEELPRENVVTEEVKLEDDAEMTENSGLVTGEFEDLEQIAAKQEELIDNDNLIYNPRNPKVPFFDVQISSYASAFLSNTAGQAAGLNEAQLLDPASTRNSPLKETRQHKETRQCAKAKITSSNIQTAIKVKKKGFRISSFQTTTKNSATKAINERKMPSCLFCDKSVRDWHCLEVHMRAHTVEKPYACKVCFQSFTRLDSLRQHKLLHTRVKMFPCPICSKLFSSKSNINSHVAAIHEHKPRRRKPLTFCIFCGKILVDHNALERHTRSHTREKPYNCHECSKSFATHQIRNDHVKIVHLRVRTFKCETCGKSFYRKDQMELHKWKMHGQPTATSRGGLSCIFCEKLLFGSYKLDQHLATHTKEKPFSCQLCSLTAATKSEIRKHVEFVHNNKKPLKCEICGKAFSRSYNMKRHVLSVHAST